MARAMGSSACSYKCGTGTLEELLDSGPQHLYRQPIMPGDDDGVLRMERIRLRVDLATWSTDISCIYIPNRPIRNTMPPCLSQSNIKLEPAVAELLVLEEAIIIA